MTCWAGHQVASSGCSAASQVPYRLEAFQEPLSCLRSLQAATVAEPIACGHVTPLDRRGRFATCTVEARPDVVSAWTRARHGFDVRLVVIGHHFVRNYASPLDRLAEERLGAGRVAVVAKEHVHHHASFVNGSIQVPFLSLAEEEHLVHEPPLADRTSPASHLCRQLWRESLDPIEDSPMRDIDAAFGQQFQNLSARERVGQVPAHSGEDHIGWPAVATEG
jgi:hypothetical protein